MHELNLIQDFAVLLLAAGGAGMLCRRFGLSAIVGYLLAGILIGPHTPPFSLILDEERIMALSQIGLVFLMFGIGLGLSLSKFARLGSGLIVATALGATGVLALAQLASLVVGWTPMQATFIAGMLMVSSSAVIVKVMTEQNKLHERSSQTALAVTVLEDVVAIMVLTILASQVDVTGGGTGSLGHLLGGLSVFVMMLIGAGLLVVPRLMLRLESGGDVEMQTVIVGGLMFALALAAAKAGYSLALGAFLFGAIVAEIPQRLGVETSFRGLRDMFSSVFFVSIGMMIDLKLIAEAWPMVLALTVVALVVRPLVYGFALILIGTPPADAKRAGLRLTPIGEFSFIIAQLGVSSAVLSPAYYPVAVGASILTILVTPLMNRHRAIVLQGCERWEPRWITRSITAYHAWFEQLRNRPARTPVWQLLRPRLGQVAIEVIIVGGLLMLSEVMLSTVAKWEFLQQFDPGPIVFGFWTLMTIFVLMPLVAIWRNCSALSLLLSEVWASPHLPRGVLENLFKAVVSLAMFAWIYLLLPQTFFGQWGWLIIVVGAAVIVARFSGRLVFWHSHLQYSMREVLADRESDRVDLRAKARASLGEDLDRWNVVLFEATLPLNSAVAGQSLADLALPSRHNCAVIEIERNGHSIDAPSGEAVLYPGDKVLCVGPSNQTETVRKLLESAENRSNGHTEMTGLVLDTCDVGEALEGKTLVDLELSARYGIRVVGIHRGSQRIINPQANERLSAGDNMLVLGTLESHRQFRRNQAVASGAP